MTQNSPATAPTETAGELSDGELSAEITVFLPDGSRRHLPDGSTAMDLSWSIGKRLAADAVCAKIDDQPVDLAAPLVDGAQVEIVTKQSPEGLHTIRHSTAHVLAQAVLSLFPGATFAIGPPIEHGFYYDFSLPDNTTFSEDDIARIEQKMREIITANQPFERGETTGEVALEMFCDHPYKKEIIRTASKQDLLGSEVSADGTISYYRNSPDFVDVCLGPHVPSTAD